MRFSSGRGGTDHDPVAATAWRMRDTGHPLVVSLSNRVKPFVGRQARDERVYSGITPMTMMKAVVFKEKNRLSMKDVPMTPITQHWRRTRFAHAAAGVSGPARSLPHRPTGGAPSRCAVRGGGLHADDAAAGRVSVSDDERRVSPEVPAALRVESNEDSRSNRSRHSAV